MGIHQLIHSRNVDDKRTESPPLRRETNIDNIRILAAALVAGTVFAAQAQSLDAAPSTHWKFGVQVGTEQDHSKTEPAVQATLGYDIDGTWSVEALVNASTIFIRDGGLRAGDREFDDAYGVRVLATLPLSERWSLLGGLGIVEFQDDIGTTLSKITEHKASAMVSLAAMYRIGRRWSVGVETSSFIQAHTFNVGLRGELHF
jgi:hypothetical protein